MKKLAIATVLLSLSTSIFANTQSLDVIYGVDNRKDVFESTDSVFVELSKSTAAMISTTNIKMAKRGEVQIAAPTLKSQGICEKERFSHQITGANCSGFLVAPNVLITAGHCMKTELDCSSFKWVFDFRVDYAEQGNVNISKKSVYSCKRVIERVLDHTTKNDFAVIELDREVKDRAPLNFRRKGKIAKGASLVVIGHPTGLPTKIADGAKVRSLSDTFFVANLDTFGGNSGSAVFNVKTSTVEGILVRGDNDYVYDPTLGCQVANVCPQDGCRGEDVTYITNIEYLKNLP